MSLSLTHPVSGEDTTNEKPLLPEHIHVGRLLWYQGTTSMYGWNCPAIIVRVNPDKKCFWVRSLDDMREQSQEYSFSVYEHSSYSRKSMRLTTNQEVHEYLESRRKVLLQNVQNKQTELEQAEKALDTFDAHTPKLSPA